MPGSTIVAGNDVCVEVWTMHEDSHTCDVLRFSERLFLLWQGHDFGTDTTNNNHNFDKGGISNGGWLSAVSPASSTGFYMVAENLFKYNANAMKRLEASDVDFMVGLTSYCIIQGFEIVVAGYRHMAHLAWQTMMWFCSER
jgi:hypothetical protein